MKRSDIEFELYCNYIDSDLIETILMHVDGQGFHAPTIDQLLVTHGYDEIFSELEAGEYPESYGEKIVHKRHLSED